MIEDGADTVPESAGAEVAPDVDRDGTGLVAGWLSETDGTGEPADGELEVDVADAEGDVADDGAALGALLVVLLDAATGAGVTGRGATLELDSGRIRK